VRRAEHLEQLGSVQRDIERLVREELGKDFRTGRGEVDVGDRPCHRGRLGSSGLDDSRDLGEQ
jgi:hypothetical protein